jgi:hypothetical protein
VAGSLWGRKRGEVGTDQAGAGRLRRPVDSNGPSAGRLAPTRLI